MDYSKFLRDADRNLNAVVRDVIVLPKKHLDKLSDENLVELVSGANYSQVIDEIKQLVASEPLANGQALEFTKDKFDLAATESGIKEIIGNVANELRQVAKGNDDNTTNLETTVRVTLEQTLKNTQPSMRDAADEVISDFVDAGVKKVNDMLNTYGFDPVESLVLLPTMKKTNLPNTAAFYSVDDPEILHKAQASVESLMQQLGGMLNELTEYLSTGAGDDIIEVRYKAKTLAQAIQISVAEQSIPPEALTAIRKMLSGLFEGDESGLFGLNPAFKGSTHKETGHRVYTVYGEAFVGRSCPKECQIIANAMASHLGLAEGVKLMPAIIYTQQTLPSEFTTCALSHTHYEMQFAEDPELGELYLVGDLKSAESLKKLILGDAFDEDRHTLGQLERSFPAVLALHRFISGSYGEIEASGTSFNVHQ